MNVPRGRDFSNPHLKIEKKRNSLSADVSGFAFPSISQLTPFNLFHLSENNLMNSLTRRMLGLMVAVSAFTFLGQNQAEAGGYRQSYSSWTYHPTHRYYYSQYRYQPVVTTTTYHHHYCVHYPSRPRYVYYYNPVRRVYWGRYDLKENGYSMLKKEDQKQDLEAIPESAFPKPGEMPAIPESSDGVKIDRPSVKDLPKVEAAADTP